MNSDNLKGHGFHERSAEEARESGRKGGIASGKARREKADMRKMAQRLLDGSFTDKNGATFTGLELVQRGLIQNLGNPNGRNWGRAMDFLIALTSAGMSKEQREHLVAETESIKARTELLRGGGEQRNGILEQLIEGLKDDLHGEAEGTDAGVAGEPAQTPEHP